MNELRFAIFGTGFWARYQLAAWKELPGARCVALYNRTKSKAVQLAADFGVPATAIYDNPEALLDQEKLDFVDIITDVDTHRKFSEMALNRGIAAICQKPMAPTLAEAAEMLALSRKVNQPLFIHENWRWQAPLRALKKELDSGSIGRIWRARIVYSNSFPVFENQPFLRELEQFILTDIGTHVLDTTRFLFGEAKTLYCHTHRVSKGIKGEDAATVMLEMANGMTVSVEMSYASRLERERFPQTYVTIEGEDASLALEFDYSIRRTDRTGTHSFRAPPRFYPWVDSRYEIVHASIVDCNANLLAALQGTGKAETTAADNYETLRLVYAAYASANESRIIQLAGG
ncbi:MAG: Gfo/Idh/MocA family oxidoreductase [Verrucomicrobiota bacterium]|nr:Gfo/Idh/MocA family oxidoreductase [Verrucomicrobiota bacterium]